MLFIHSFVHSFSPGRGKFHTRLLLLLLSGWKCFFFFFAIHLRQWMWMKYPFLRLYFSARVEYREERRTFLNKGKVTLGFGCQRRRAQEEEEEEFPFRYVVPSATALHCTGLDIIFWNDTHRLRQRKSTVRCGVHMFVFTAAAAAVTVVVAQYDAVRSV